MAGLKGQYIQIVNEQGRVIGNGSNQEWFSDKPWCNVKGQGCGIIAALDACYHISGNNRVDKDEYGKRIESFLKCNPLSKLYMHQFFGKYALGLTPWQICRYINQCLKGSYKACYNGRYGHDDMLEKMEEMLDNDIPVIWSLYRMGKKITLYSYKAVTREYIPIAYTNSHYVNAIAVTHDASDVHKTMVKISSWGKLYYIDYDEYLEYVKGSLISSVCSNIILIKKKL